jgi:hypothetical protein
MAGIRVAIDLNGSLTKDTENEFERRGWGSSLMKEPFREMIFLIADSLLRRSANEIVKPVNTFLSNGLYDDVIDGLLRLRRKMPDVEMFVCTSNRRLSDKDKLAIKKALASRGLDISGVEVRSVKDKSRGADLLIEDGAISSIYSAQRGVPVVIPGRSYNRVFGKALGMINPKIRYAGASDFGEALEKSLTKRN